MFGKLRMPTPEESLCSHRSAICSALRGKCPACLEQLTGHRYSDYADASESNQELVTVLLTAFNAGDWRAVSKIHDIDVLYDIWTVILLECPKNGLIALRMLDYYEPALGLQMVDWKRFDPPSNLELKPEWRGLMP